MPTQKRIEYIMNVLSPDGLLRVLQDLRSWGNSDTVVKTAATKPTIVIESKAFSSFKVS